MRIMVADDHGLFREGLYLQLKMINEEADIVQAEDFDDAIEQFGDGADYDLVIVDLNMPGGPWNKALPSLAAEGCRVIVMSASEEISDIEEALDAGAHGFIPKSSNGSILAGALKLVMNGGTYIPPAMLRSRPKESACGLTFPIECNGGAISKRQYEVLQMIEKGMSNKQIAYEMDLVEGTIKLHITSILKALGATNRTQAVFAAKEAGILS